MVAYGTKLAGISFEDAERDWFERRYAELDVGEGLLFRAEAVSYSYVIDADREEYGSTSPQLELFGYQVLRWTPHGATLKHVYSGARPKWVDLRPGAKQWASRTAREAVEQFRDRRQRQLYVLARQRRRAKAELNLAVRALHPVHTILQGAPGI